MAQRATSLGPKPSLSFFFLPCLVLMGKTCLFPLRKGIFVYFSVSPFVFLSLSPSPSLSLSLSCSFRSLFFPYFLFCFILLVFCSVCFSLLFLCFCFMRRTASEYLFLKFAQAPFS